MHRGVRHTGRIASLWVSAALAVFVGFAANPVAAQTLEECQAVGAECTLRQAAALAGVPIGAAVGPGFFDSDPLYVPTLVEHFDSLTAENAHKWPAIHPAQDTWNFGPADAVVELAEDNDMRVRGHTLLWANPIRIPAYVNAMDSAEVLRAELALHISTVVGRYAGRIEAWDVVNEPLFNLGTELYDNVFLQHLGPGYIAEAFHLAHAADPDALLFLNEIFVTIPGSDRFQAFYELVEGLVNAGVPIHGVGFQTHLLGGLVDVDPAEFEAATRAFADLGLVVEITEMDVPMLGGNRPLRRQAAIVSEVMGACLRVEACRAVTFWGFTDLHTWIDGTFGPGFQPLLFNTDYEEKPSYFAARDALLVRAPEPEGSALVLAVCAALGTLARVSRRAVGGSRPMPKHRGPDPRASGR